MTQIACLGECMLELSQNADGHDQLGFGGDTLNTAVYLARLGQAQGHTVSYVTALGTDPMSEEMVNAWTAEGIDQSLIARLPDKLPGLYIIRTNADGERGFYYWREQAAVRSLLDGDRLDALTRRLVAYDVLYLSGVTLGIFRGERRERLLQLVRDCAAAGVAVAFDTNYRPALWPDVQAARAAYSALAPSIRYAFPSADDEDELFGPEAASGAGERWLSLGASEVIVKHGAAPCVISRCGYSAEVVPAPIVVSPLDTTAAGDSFAAAYLHHRLTGRDVRAAALAGHTLAAWVISHPGAIAPREDNGR